MSKNNLSVRQELAALYRILDMYGMTDLANQCAAARSSENKNIYLVHQYGMFYDEITASSLIELATSWTERYGSIPKPVLTLLEVMKLKLLAKKCGFSRIKQIILKA